MANLINRGLRFLSFKVIGRTNTKRALLWLFQALDLNILDVAHNKMGINNYGDNVQTGEDYFLRVNLLDKFQNKELVIFDVGANLGEYTLLLNKLFPLSNIYAFEPNPSSFEFLTNKTSTIKNIHSFCFGVGTNKNTTSIYSYKNNPASEHASIIKNVMTEIHQSDNVIEFKIDIIDLDSFCDDNNILKIDFLKIDTEGYELEVLKGASKLIKNKSIEVIQFEFNEMNIFSRVFLKDFYTLLPEYSFYRLDTDKLIPLDKYNSSNEIFRYQNIIAFLS